MSFVQEMSNYKGKLQEYCQEHKIANPVYDCKPVTKDGRTLWYPRATYNGQDYYIEYLFQNKREAEQEIAMQILDRIRGYKVEDSVEFQKDKVEFGYHDQVHLIHTEEEPHSSEFGIQKHLIYIDLENIQPQLNSKIPDQLRIQCFVSIDIRAIDR